MNIAIDETPLTDKSITHRVRGTGFYIENLKKSLLQYFSSNKYIFFNRGDLLPKDIEVVHYPYFEPFFLTLPFRKTHKTVVTVHDLTPFVFPDHFPTGIKGALKWALQKNLLKAVDAIITDSQSSKDDIIRYTGIPGAKITVVYLAAGEEFKRIQNSLLPELRARAEFRIQNLRRRYGLPEKFALYVGDVTWNKNLPRLVEAIKKTNIPLVMVGKALGETNFDESNPWNKDLSTVQQLVKNNKQFILTGFVNDVDLICLYNMATVFAMPSIYEGFGLPILEAMQCGCPVVTAKEGSLPEVAGNAALYVDAYDISSIANGIKKVFFDKDLQNSFSKKGFEQAKKFSWKKTSSQTIEIYEKVF